MKKAIFATLLCMFILLSTIDPILKIPLARAQHDDIYDQLVSDVDSSTYDSGSLNDISSGGQVATAEHSAEDYMENGIVSDDSSPSPSTISRESSSSSSSETLESANETADELSEFLTVSISSVGPLELSKSTDDNSTATSSTTDNRHSLETTNVGDLQLASGSDDVAYLDSTWYGFALEIDNDFLAPYLYNFKTSVDGAYYPICVGQDLDPLLWKRYYRGFAQWDTSSIPDGSDIISVKLSIYLDPWINPFIGNYVDDYKVDMDFYQMSRKPSSYGRGKPNDNKGRDLFNDAKDGTLYTWYTYVYQGGGWYDINLGSSAAQDLENQLGSNWFAIGLHEFTEREDGTGQDRGLSLLGGGYCYLTVSYTPPPTEYDEYFYSIEVNPFDNNGDGYNDAVQVKMDVDTTNGTLTVHVNGYLDNPSGSQIDSDSDSWQISGYSIEYGYIYLYVSSSNPQGWYTVRLYLYDNNWNFEDSYSASVYLYPPEMVSSVTVNPNGGRIYVDGTPITSKTTYLWTIGSTHTLNPDSGYSPSSGKRLLFIQWSDGSTADPRHITVSGDVTYKAQWKTQYRLTIAVSPAGTGTTNPSAGSYWRDSGSSVTITETPNSGYAFDHWDLDGDNVGIGSSYTVMINAPHSVTAFFIRNVVVVRGYIYYLDQNNNPKPVRYATVNLYDKTWYGSRLLTDIYGDPCSTWTNHEGYYEFEPVENVDEIGGSGTLDLYIELLCDSGAVKVVPVLPINIWPYRGYSTVSWDVHARDSPYTISMTVTDPDKKGSWGIYDAILEAYQATEDNIGYQIPKVPVVWPWITTATWELFDLGYIGIESGYEWDTDVILHEYGHWVMAQLYQGLPITSILDYGFPDFTHTWNSQEIPKVAWVEGWANFYSVAIRNDRYFWFYDLESQWPTGDNVEGAIAGILWDIYDSPPNDDDGLSMGLAPIWDVLKNYFTSGHQASNIHEFWDGWFARGHDHFQQMWDIFDPHGISKPHLNVWPSSLSFIGSGTQPFNIQNDGGETLTWSASESASWITDLSPSSGSLSSGQTESVSVTVSVAGLSAGHYSHEISITSNDGTATVMVNLGIPATIEINPNGGKIYVDGSPITVQTTYAWSIGSTHTLDPESPYMLSSDTRLVFAQWNDGSKADPRTITVTASATYTALWNTQYQLTISVSPSGSGTTSPSTGSYWYNSGTSVTVSATPNTGYTFNHWDLDGSNVGTEIFYSVYMGQPHVLTAVFEGDIVSLSISISIVSPPILGETVSLDITLENTGTATIPSGDYEITISFWDYYEEGGIDSFWVWIDGNKYGNAISQIGPSESQTVTGIPALSPGSTHVISGLEFAVPDMQQPSLVLADTLTVQVSGPGVSATGEVKGLDVNLGMATYYNALVTVAVAGLGAHLEIPLAAEGWAVVETAVNNCEKEWSEMVDAFNAGNLPEAAKHAARVFLGWGLWTPDMTLEERMDILVDMLVNYVKGPLSIANIIIWWVNFKYETYLNGFDLLSLSFIQAIGRSLGLSLFTDPTNLLVVDPLGRRSGFDFETGVIINEIPDAYIYGLDGNIEAIFISELLEGEYDVYIVGLTDGPFGLHVEAANGTALVSDNLYSGAISAGEILGSDVIVTQTPEGLQVTSSPPTPLGRAYTDKEEYGIGETVLLGFENIGDVLITLTNTAPWVILDDSMNIVYTAIGLLIPVDVSPGEKKEWQWNQEDDYGQQVPLGTYFFQIETSAGTFTVSFSILDVTPPTIEILSPENTTYTTNTVDLTFTISEPAFWIGYSLDGQANITITGNTVLNGLAEGSHNIIVYANDTSGNMGFSNKVYFTIDTIPPTTSIDLSGTLGLDDWYVSDVIVTLTGVDVVSGVYITVYSFDGVTWIIYTGPFTIIDEGITTIHYNSTDNAGNIENTKITIVKIDKTNPTITIYLAGTLGNDGWYVSDVTVTLQTSDVVSGILKIEYSFDGDTWIIYTTPFTIDTEGTTTVHVRSTDNAGNVETETFDVKIDKTPPVTTDSLSGTFSNGWYTSEVTITLDAFDATSGVENIYYKVDNDIEQIYSAPFLVSGDGPHTIEFWSTDNAGNIETHHTDTFQIDTTAPITTASLSGTLGLNDWYVTSVQVTLTAEDPGESSIPPTGSGIYKTYYIIDGGLQTEYIGPFTVSEQGSHTIQFWSVDIAGNTEVPNTMEFKIDTITPATTASQSPDGDNGWWKTSPATVILSASDATSGVMEIHYQVDLGIYVVVPGTSAPVTVEGNGIHSVNYYAVDSAGNQEYEKTETVKIDTTPPTTTLNIGTPKFTTGTDVYVTTATSFTLSPSDNPEGSGVATTYYRVYPVGAVPPPFDSGTTFQISDGDGEYIIEYYSTDNAGNEESLNSETVILDNTPPATIKTVGSPSYDDFVTSATLICLDASDSGSDLESTYYRINGNSWIPYSGCFTLSGPDGTYIIEFYSIDNLGNTEIVHSQTHKLDNTAPSSYISLSGTMGDNDWFVSSVTLTLSADDGSGSGVATIYHILDDADTMTYSASFLVTEDGWHTIEFWSVDNLGNTESPHNTDSFKIDTTSPSTLASLNPETPNGQNSWYTVPVEVTLTADDETSGVAITYYRINDGAQQVYTIPFTISDDGIYTIDFWSIDNAGNIETAKSVSFKIDQAAPTTLLTIGDPNYDTDPTYVSTTTDFTLEATDAMSGVDYIEFKIDSGAWMPYSTPFNVLDFGSHTVYYRSIDIAGNIEDIKSVWIVVNATSLMYSGDTTSQYSDPVTVEATLIDMATQQPISDKSIIFTIGSQSTTSVTNSQGIAVASIVLDQPAGEYTVSATFAGDEEYLESFDSRLFTIEKEDASVDYTGDTVVPTTTKTINLRATVFDSPDSWWGDLTKMQVTFRIYTALIDLNNPVAVVGPVSVTQTDMPGVGVAVAEIPNLPENGYLIIVSIDDNDYYRGPTSDPIPLTVYEPTGEFVTGGGWIWDPTGSKGNFGFNVKYTRSGKPKGHSIYVYRDGEWDYIVKSNAWIGLAIDSTENHAYFEAKCVVQKYNPETGELVWDEGNYKFRVDVWDNDSGGGVDVYQIRVLDKNGVVFHEAGFDPLGELQGGNIVIHDKRKKKP